MEGPFTQEIVDKIKKYQKCPIVHPLTCEFCSTTMDARLEHLFCPKCGAIQTWIPDCVLEMNLDSLEDYYRNFFDAFKL